MRRVRGEEFSKEKEKKGKQTEWSAFLFWLPLLDSNQRHPD
jgi:hypothetical protein